MKECNATFIGSPSPVRLYQAFARIYSERYGVDVRLERVRNKETGEVIWEAGEEGKNARSA